MTSLPDVVNAANNSIDDAIIIKKTLKSYYKTIPKWDNYQINHVSNLVVAITNMIVTVTKVIGYTNEPVLSSSSSSSSSSDDQMINNVKCMTGRCRQLMMKIQRTYIWLTCPHPVRSRKDRHGLRTAVRIEWYKAKAAACTKWQRELKPYVKILSLPITKLSNRGIAPEQTAKCSHQLSRLKHAIIRISPVRMETITNVQVRIDDMLRCIQDLDAIPMAQLVTVLNTPIPTITMPVRRPYKN